MDVFDCAIQIVKKLKQAGYIAYFAGGWVRDHLLKHPSDDIDIATNAPPEEISRLFPHTILVGLAFGVVIVVMNGHQFEVATFRKDFDYVEGRRPAKIELSTPEEDALRRDFTINGMFYDPLTETIYDYVQGKKDLEQGIIRTIGSPHERFGEDRLRMIRAIRFAMRFNFDIDIETQKAIQTYAHTLFPAVAMERIWQEFNKMSKSKRFAQGIVEMHRLGLLPIIFPALRNMHLKTVEERVGFYNQFPENTPTILYLLELFPDMPVEELLELCQYLKTSVQESKWVEFAVKGKTLLTQEEMSQEVQQLKWAQFYSDKLFQVCFDVLSVRYPEDKRKNVLVRHEQRRTRLQPHIQRIIERKPLVTAAVLQDYGIKPGKQMGMLLKEAEKIAVEHDLHNPVCVMDLLKETPLWPKGTV